MFDDSQKSNSGNDKNGIGLFDANLLDLPIGQTSKYTNATDTKERPQQLQGSMTSIPKRPIIQLQAPWMTSKPKMNY